MPKSIESSGDEIREKKRVERIRELDALSYKILRTGKNKTERENIWEKIKDFRDQVDKLV